MKIKIKLPAKVQVDDYHKFRYLQDSFQIVDKRIKVKEIGTENGYHGIVYVGNLKSEENAETIRQIIADNKD